MGKHISVQQQHKHTYVSFHINGNTQENVQKDNCKPWTAVSVVRTMGLRRWLGRNGQEWTESRKRDNHTYFCIQFRSAITYAYWNNWKIILNNCIHTNNILKIRWCHDMMRVSNLSFISSTNTCWELETHGWDLLPLCLPSGNSQSNVGDRQNHTNI